MGDPRAGGDRAAGFRAMAAAPIPCSTPLYSRGAPLLSALTPLSSVRRSARISVRNSSKNSSTSCGSLNSFDANATPGRRISKPKFSQLSQKLLESNTKHVKKSSGANKIKLDPVKPPIKRKSKTENKSVDDKENDKPDSHDDESIHLRSGTKLNLSKQKSLNLSKETDKRANGHNKSKEKIDKSKKLTVDKSHETPEISIKNKSSTRRNVSKLKNDPIVSTSDEITNDSLKSKSRKVNGKKLPDCHSDESFRLRSGTKPKLINVSNETDRHSDGQNESKEKIDRRKTKNPTEDKSNEINDLEVDTENNNRNSIATKGLSTFNQNSNTLLIRRKLYSQNLDIEDHPNSESSFLESVNVKNIYEPKKRESKNRQSSDQTNMFSSEATKNKESTLVKYSLRRNDTTSNDKNNDKTKLSQLLTGILNGINIKKNETSTEKHLDKDIKCKKNNKAEEINNDSKDNEKLDDSDLSMFNVKSHLKENTVKRSPRIQNLKKISPSTKTSQIKKPDNVNKEIKTSKKETSNTKKEIVAVKNEVKINKKEIVKAKKLHHVETIDIVTSKCYKKPVVIPKNNEFKRKELTNGRRENYEKFYTEDSLVQSGYCEENDSDDELAFFGLKNGKLITSGKFSDNTFKKPLLPVTRNGTMISKNPQVSHIESFYDEYPKNSFLYNGREKSSLKQVQQTRQLVHPYNIVKKSPETFSWKQMMGNNRKRKLETHFRDHSSEMSSVFNSRNGNFHMESSRFTNVTTISRSFFPSDLSMRPPMLQVQNSFNHCNNSRAVAPINMSSQPDTSYYKKCLRAAQDVFNDDSARNDEFKVPNSFSKRRKVETNNETVTFQGSYHNIPPRSGNPLLGSSASYSRFQRNQYQDSDFECRSLYDRPPNRFLNGNSTTYSEFGNNTFKQPSNVPFIFKGSSAKQHVEKTMEKEVIINRQVNYHNSQTRHENTTMDKSSKPITQIKEKTSNILNKLFAKYNIKPPETSGINENKLHVQNLNTTKYNGQSYSVKKYNSMMPLSPPIQKFPETNSINNIKMPVHNPNTNRFNEQSYTVKKYNSILPPPPPIHKSVDVFETPEVNISDDTDDDDSDFDVTIPKSNKTVIVNKQAVLPTCSPWRFRK